MPLDCIQTVRAFYAAFQHDDVPAFCDLMDSAIEWTAAENLIYNDRSPYIGKDAVVDLVFRRLRSDWENFVMDPQEILGRDDLVIASGRFRGTFKANGATLDAQFVQVFHLKDGKVARCQMYTDTAQFKESISALRASETA